MPVIFRAFTVRWILLAGLGAWTLRYVLLAAGDPGAGMWMIYIAILLHGICYDFFFVTGQLYTDHAAPAHLRSTAQGFITCVTYGVGMLIGSLLSGVALDYYSHPSAAGIARDWKAFWMSTAAMSFVITLIVLVFFNSRARLRAHKAEAAEDSAVGAPAV